MGRSCWGAICGRITFSRHSTSSRPWCTVARRIRLLPKMVGAGGAGGDSFPAVYGPEGGRASPDHHRDVRGLCAEREDK